MRRCHRRASPHQWLRRLPIAAFANSSPARDRRGRRAVIRQYFRALNRMKGTTCSEKLGGAPTLQDTRTLVDVFQFNKLVRGEQAVPPPSRNCSLNCNAIKRETNP